MSGRISFPIPLDLDFWALRKFNAVLNIENVAEGNKFEFIISPKSFKEDISAVLMHPR